MALKINIIKVLWSNLAYNDLETFNVKILCTCTVVSTLPVLMIVLYYGYFVQVVNYTPDTHMALLNELYS